MRSKNVLNKVVNVSAKVVGKKQQQQKTLSELYECRVVRKARMIAGESSHVLFQYYNKLPSERRFRVSKTKTDQGKVIYLSTT